MHLMTFDRKLLGAFAAVLLLAACSTSPEETAGASGEGAATTSTTPTVTAEPSKAPTTPAAETIQPSGPRPGSQEDLVLNVGDRVFFDFDKSDLKPEARRTLERQAAWLKRYPNVKVIIEGHADERGTREYNLALGDRRANSAKNYLIALGIDPARLSTISYGKERPEALGSNEAAWAQNRRAVTVVN